MDRPTPTSALYARFGSVLNQSNHHLLFFLAAFLAALFGECIRIKRARSQKLKRKYFEQNGGILLRQQLDSHQQQTTRIFTEKELKKATKDYHKDKILGQGVFGTVYRGTLPDKQVVVVKKYNPDAAVINRSQFINAVVAGSSHEDNLVRILGCCLETKIPLIVYEYVTNATSLYQKIRNKMLLSWELRLKIAAEIAGALAYLHCSTEEEVVHCNVKTTNVILDKVNKAKLSDLGTAGWISAFQFSTIVERTLGYLDPEYLRTKTFTKSSDVYSFGVVLVELLTSKEAFSFDRPDAERNLASFFVRSGEENGALALILDPELVFNDGNFETVEKVANIAKRCLKLKGEGRPTMKEVAVELQGLRSNEGEGTSATRFLPSPEESDYFLQSMPASYAYVVDVRGDYGDDNIRPIGS